MRKRQKYDKIKARNKTRVPGLKEPGPGPDLKCRVRVWTRVPLTTLAITFLHTNLGYPFMATILYSACCLLECPRVLFKSNIISVPRANIKIACVFKVAHPTKDDVYVVELIYICLKHILRSALSFERYRTSTSSAATIKLFRKVHILGCTPAVSAE